MEQEDDAEQPRHDIYLIGDVGLVGRNDRDPEHVVEAGGEHREPHQRTHQRRQQPSALLHELDDLPGGHGAQRLGGMGDPHGGYLFIRQEAFRLIVAERIERVGPVQKALDRRARDHGIRRGEQDCLTQLVVPGTNAHGKSLVAVEPGIAEHELALTRRTPPSAFAGWPAPPS